MGILDQLIYRISGSQPSPAQTGLTRRMVLGALLSLVARADGKVSDVEETAKRAALARQGYSDPKEQNDILTMSVRVLEERIDWQGLTREINQDFSYEERLRLLADLFSVAWADHDLSHSELETLRKISELLWIAHRDFIDAKLSTKPPSA